VDGYCDLKRASRVCVVFFEELGGSVPRRLIVMTRCEGVAFQARASSARILSDFAMPAMRLTASQAK
jgi:hypothetical protein